MNVNLYVIKEYERNDIFAVPENKANSNPISKQLQTESAAENVRPVVPVDIQNRGRLEIGLAIDYMQLESLAQLGRLGRLRFLYAK